MSLHITYMHANDKWGMGQHQNSVFPLCIFQFCFSQLLLLHLLQCVPNPPSRHACPLVRRFANSDLRLWRRSLMKTTCTHSHDTHIPINTSFHHSTTSIATTEVRSFQFDKFLFQVLYVTAGNLIQFQYTFDPEAPTDMISCD